MKLRISHAAEAMQKQVLQGACVGEGWRMMWGEGSQTWCRLPISPSQDVLGRAIPHTAPGFLSEGTSCPVPRGLGSELVILQGGCTWAGSHRGI